MLITNQQPTTNNQQPTNNKQPTTNNQQLIKTAAVLGAGVMGSQIAAHLANAGLTVYLLDLPGKENNKNTLVEKAFKKASKLKPPIFFTKNIAHRIILGNFEDDFHRLAKVDWIIEAVVENLAIKQQLMAQLEEIVSPDAIISTNTSGLPIHKIAEARSDFFRSRFLGTHFFNPPRYLKLLELIPTSDTNQQVLERMKWFGRFHLGKGVVVAKDTPNFIANRIGIYNIMLALRAFTDWGYTIEEIDTLTGTLVGRPKSATFRTADLVGLDTLLYVTNNLYQSVKEDESREIFRVPDILQKLVQMGALGAKTGQGFYRKDKGQILSLNPVTGEYEPPKPLDLGEIETIAKIGNLTDRLHTLYQDPGRAGEFFRLTTLAMLDYSARRIPEIADSPADIDRAMMWGFGWELGPFALWDVLGFEKVLEDEKALPKSSLSPSMEKVLIDGKYLNPVPDWIAKMQQECAVGFYWQKEQVYVPGKQQYLPLVKRSDEIDLESAPLVWENPEAALLDLGDGVVLYQFRSKGNTLSSQVLAGLFQVLELLEKEDWRGLVIGNNSPNFCGGANLAEMGGLAQAGDLDGINHLLVKFQGLMLQLRYFPKPIVAAVAGRALGGGCELVMACPQVVAAAESYMGLVELGVGLIPAAGGLMGMVARAAARGMNDSVNSIQPFLQQAFTTIAMATVANSAWEAQELGFLAPQAKMVMNGDRHLYVAKQEVISLDLQGYVPPPKRNAIMVLGRPGRAQLEQLAYNYLQGGFISEYDYYLGEKLAYVMTGGDLTVPTLVSEDYLLQLERNAFLPLLGENKTQERIAYLLKNKKPLRN